MRSCKECKSRYKGCHDHCEIYKREQEEHLKKEADIKRMRKESIYAVQKLKWGGGTTWHK